MTALTIIKYLNIFENTSTRLCSRRIFLTLARNKALENAGWINFRFKLKRNAFEDDKKVKKEIIEEFVCDARKLIDESLLNPKLKQVASFLSESVSTAASDRKYKDDVAKAVHSVSKFRFPALPKKAVNGNASLITNKTPKPPIFFGPHGAPMGCAAASSMASAAASSSFLDTGEVKSDAESSTSSEITINTDFSE